MKKNKPLYIAILFYFLCILTLLFYTFVELYPRIFMSPIARVVVLSVSCLFAYMGSRALCKYRNLQAEKIMRWTFAWFFVLYLGLLLNFTLLDPMFFRTGKVGTVFSKPGRLSYYFNHSFNMIPFSTIWEYLTSFIGGTKRLTIIVTNLVGNLIAMMPMALFLPVLFKKCRKPLPFVLVTAAITAAIEFLQFLWMTGACDIDDLILNISGAVMAYGILRIRPIHSIAQKITRIEF